MDRVVDRPELRLREDRAHAQHREIAIRRGHRAGLVDVRDVLLGVVHAERECGGDPGDRAVGGPRRGRAEWHREDPRRRVVRDLGRARAAGRRDDTEERHAGRVDVKHALEIGARRERRRVGRGREASVARPPCPGRRREQDRAVGIVRERARERPCPHVAIRGGALRAPGRARRDPVIRHLAGSERHLVRGDHAVVVRRAQR